MCGLGVPVGCRMKHAKGMFKRCRLGAALLPARFGVPSSFCTVCRVLRVLRVRRWTPIRPGKRQAWTSITAFGCKGFKRFKGFKGLRAGGCGLGAAVACAVRRSEQLLHSLQGFKNIKGKCLRPGKRQAWTPITGCKGFKGFEGF